MKFTAKIVALLMLCSLSTILWSCKQSDADADASSEYGYVQIKVSKLITKGITSGAELPNLAVARKMKVTFIHENRTISQTLNLESSPIDAEYGLQSETLELMAGQYQLVSYEIYGDAGALLQTADVPNLLTVIKAREITILPVEVSAVLTGRMSVVLDPDRSSIIMPNLSQANLAPQTGDARSKVAAQNAAPSDVIMYNYPDIKSVDFVLQNKAGITTRFNNIQVKENEEHLLSADTLLSAIAGEYKLVEYTIYGVGREALLTDRSFVKEIKIVIENNAKTEARVPVKLQLNEAIKDYMALKSIWDAMEGPSWSCHAFGMVKGSNWNFNRPVELWGAQPGVFVHTNGRVAAMSLGSFNPVGAIPDAIGQFTQMESLWLGESGESGPEGGVDAAVSSLSRYMAGQSLSKTRIAAGKQYLANRHPSTQSPLMLSLKNGNHTAKHIDPKDRKPYDAGPNIGRYANRITAISDKIGNLTKLEFLSICNGYVTELPATFDKLVNLTDLDIYNCPKMVAFPEIVAKLPMLISFNFAGNEAIPTANLEAGLTKLFDGLGKAEIQLLYLSQDNLVTLPANVKNLIKLSLLDISDCKLTGTLTPLGKNVGIVQLHAQNNKLTAIGKDADNFFTAIDDVESISFAGNLLTEVPDIFKPEGKYTYQLGSVDLSGNKITKFADGFTGISVSTLNLSENNFTGTFPKDLSSRTAASQVTNLNLSYNKIDSLPGQAIDSLYMLSAFEAVGNNLDELPFEFNGKNLPYLVGLDLSRNAFTKIPVIALDVSALTSLFFEDQFSRVDNSRSLTTWLTGMYKHKGLRVCRFYGNDFRLVDQFPSMLNYLDIGDNPNIKMIVPFEITRRIFSLNDFKLLYDKNQDIIFEGR